ncbi:MAG: hypothetical protein F6J98_04215 [Moorea sp. SIO4G2]|nr:hypothetical protein [Moorena sp. SIO4G2]
MNKRVLLVVDQAGWHIALDVVLPVGIHRFELPLHSTQLQPAERLWPLETRDCGQSFPQKYQRGTRIYWSIVVSNCWVSKTLIGGLTCFDWWPRTRQT